MKSKFRLVNVEALYDPSIAPYTKEIRLTLVGNLEDTQDVSFDQQFMVFSKAEIKDFFEEITCKCGEKHLVIRQDILDKEIIDKL